MKGIVDSVYGTSTSNTVSWFPNTAQASLKFQDSKQSSKAPLPQLLHASATAPALRNWFCIISFHIFFQWEKY